MCCYREKMADETTASIRVGEKKTYKLQFKTHELFSEKFLNISFKGISFKGIKMLG